MVDENGLYSLAFDFDLMKWPANCWHCDRPTMFAHRIFGVPIHPGSCTNAKRAEVKARNVEFESARQFARSSYQEVMADRFLRGRQHGPMLSMRRDSDL